MTTLLLDTHILLAVIEERVDTLDREMRDKLRSSGVILYASVASLWEIAIKVRVGKLQVKRVLAGLPDLVDQSGLTLMVIEASHVLAEVDLLPPTRDPFDRLLLAQCSVEKLRLVTLDRALVGHPLSWRPA